MLNALILLAQEAPEKVAEKGTDPGFFSNPMLPILAMIAAFFFLIVLPSQRRQKQERDAIMTTLKKNDEVVTLAGIIGIVTHIKENADEVTLKIDDNAKIRVLKSSIVRIVKKDEPAAVAPAANTSIKPS